MPARSHAFLDMSPSDLVAAARRPDPAGSVAARPTGPRPGGWPVRRQLAFVTIAWMFGSICQTSPRAR
jgi:hypothetical protein